MALKVNFIPGIPNRSEFGPMFGGWLTKYEGLTILIDCGVGTGGESLVKGLKTALGPRPLNYVLLTHIHLDHAGGLPHIFSAWPQALAVVHQKGCQHLANPDRLWAGTQKVMGELAEMYGRPSPLEPGRLISHLEADLPGLQILETPGHAAHHLSFRLGETWFLGEAAGCPYYSNNRLFNRPATPPNYRPTVMNASLDLLLAQPDGPAHTGHIPEPAPSHECLETSRHQLAFWTSLITSPDSALRPGESRQDHLNRLTQKLFQEDPYLRPLQELPAPALWREKYFLKNSVEGFVDYYADPGD